MNYLQLNDYSRFEPEEQSLANYFGKDNYVSFYRKDIVTGKIKITKEDFVAGTIESMFAAMNQLGITYTYNDYPECLQKYLCRKIWNSTVGEIKSKLQYDDYIDPVFIKPKNNLKRFTGFVIDSVGELNNLEHADDNQEISCSEPVIWISEYRAPVIHGKIQDICFYKGNKNTPVDKQILQAMVDDFENSPEAYCIDVGVLSGGKTALIEVNDAFSVGKYSMSDDLYAKLLITRWNELKRFA